MQPVQIGMNAAVVLVVLLLAVPIQLIVSHYISRGWEDEEGRGINEIRAAAVNRLGQSTQGLVEELYSTFSYYSSWNHLKELVLVPHKRKVKSTDIHLQTTVIKSERGTTTILITSADTSQKQKQGTKPSKPKDRLESAEKATKPGKVQTKLRTAAAVADSKSKHDNKESSKKVVEEGTSRATEVEEYLMKEVYFSQSKAPRKFRPPTVRYSVGQVVKHNTDGYYGVIIGWDEVAKAPESWLKKYYSNSRRQNVVKTPHYLVLVDSHFDASGTPLRYLPQEDVQIVTDVQIQCPELSEYFESYKNGRHIPKPWLQKRYPQD